MPLGLWTNDARQRRYRELEGLVVERYGVNTSISLYVCAMLDADDMDLISIPLDTLWLRVLCLVCDYTRRCRFHASAVLTDVFRPDTVRRRRGFLSDARVDNGAAYLSGT